MALTRRFQLAAVTLFSLMALSALSAVPAFAANPCDQTVYDGAQVFKGDQSSVEAAAQKLSQVGADVRVLTLKDLGGQSTLDALIKDQQNSCGSWKGSDGHRKNNLLVFAMALKERKVGIYYGDRWVAAFDQSGGDLRVQSDFMGPQFRNGNFAGGFADGMNESYRIINNFLHPQKGGGGPAVVVNKKPTDYSGLFKVFGFIAAALFVLALLGFGYIVMRRRQKENEDREAMRQRALSARDDATRILQVLGDKSRQDVRSAKVTKYAAAGGDVPQRLQNALKDVNSNYEAATDGLSAAASASGTADDKGLPIGVYEQMAQRYETVLKQAKAAEKADALIDNTCGGLDKDLQQMSSDLEQIQAGLAQVSSQLQPLKAEGIKVDGIEQHLAAATTEVASATNNTADLTSLAHVAQAQTQLKDAQSALESLNAKRQQLQEGVPALQGRITDVGSKLDGARKCFERISGTYAESSWTSVQGNGTEAEKRINAAGQKLADATHLSQTDKQEWDDALASMQEGNQLLDKAESLLESITALEEHLHTAQKQAPKEIADAKTDLSKAGEYLHTYDADIRDNLEKDLADAADQVSQAEAELAKPKPDYLEVVRLATTANSAADHIYATAVDEHEAAERLRRQAATTLTQAQAAISRAEQYIDDHSSDMSGSAETDLDDAHHELQAAQAAKSTAKVLEHATNALQYATDAYNSAEGDFEEAEDRRRRRREEQEAAVAASYAASHSYSSSSGSDSFGSSSSWGGGGGGGGSSISFGGGGGGGGSSSGW
jgi:uncharacterized membrane protein YgcG